MGSFFQLAEQNAYDEQNEQRQARVQDGSLACGQGVMTIWLFQVNEVIVDWVGDPSPMVMARFGSINIS